jgi:fructoselysine-6-P-deglycase FrlB-like protein
MSVFLNEVSNQPDVLLNQLDLYEREHFCAILQAAELIEASNTVVFSGMGSSFYAPQCIMHTFTRHIRPIMVEASELLQNGCVSLKENDLLVLISQSGESAEIKQLCELCSRMYTIIAITNDESSTLAKSADVLLPLYAGEERSITSKTFTNTMAVLYMLSYSLERRSISELTDQLSQSVEHMNIMLHSRIDEINAVADALKPANAIHFIGRNGSEMTIANQSSLIFMEGAGCYARAFTTGGFRHGPIEMCSPEHRSILYVSSEKTAMHLYALARHMKQLGSKIAFVTNQDVVFPFSISIEGKTRIQFTIEAAMAMELILIRTAEQRNRIAGEFSITSKICELD